MPRRVQDIVPNEHRSIRDVPLHKESPVREPARGRKKKETGEEIVPIRKKTAPISAKIPITPPVEHRRATKRSRRALIAIGIIVVVGFIGYLASSHYSRASFTIVPKIIPVSVDKTYTAKAKSAPGYLAYDLVTLKGTASSTVRATDGPQISTKAQGKVLLYNAYSNQPVKLMAGTRIANDSKLVYRLTGSIVIPGYTKSGVNIIPGSVSAGIVADQSGSAYNISRADSISDFKIVAYAGSPKYGAVYARLTTDVSGGFVGTKKTVNPTALASTTEQMKSAITASLLSQAKGSIPPGYIMYDDSYVTQFSPASVGGSSSGQADVGVTGTLYGIIFKESELVSVFAGDGGTTSFGRFGYTAPGLEKLDVSIASLKDFQPDKKNALIVKVKGDMKLVGNVPVDDIKKKLEGISLGKTQDIFKSYSAVIDSGTGELVPPWAKVPTNPDHIQITVDSSD